MNTLKQGMAAIAFVASLGLVTSASIAGPASTDVSSESKGPPQPMSIKCDLDGKKANGFEYESEVNSADFGGDLGKMRDVNSDREFVAVSGYVTTILTAIEDKKLFPQDDSSAFAKKPLDAGDPRLAGGYPVTLEYPRGYPLFFKIKAKDPKKGSLVRCIATDLGIMNDKEARDVMGSTQCRLDGVLQDECYQNIWSPASEDDVTESRPCVAFDDKNYRKCMALGVNYHYEDIYHIQARVTLVKDRQQ